jgi:hypothetical protein
MIEFKFKHQYIESKRLSALFRMAFFLVFATFVMVSGTLLLPSDVSYTFGGGPLSTALFWLFFCFLFVLMCANLFLWIGMLQFLLKYDGRKAKLFWLFIVFFGLSYGAALYYFFIFIKVMARFAVGSSQGNVSHPTAIKM